MDECHFQHGAEVFGGLLETREDAARFFEPADQAFNDAALPICFAIEGNESVLAVVAVFARYHRINSQFEEVFVNPVGPLTLVASQGDWPRVGFSGIINQFCISSHKQRIEHDRIMRLTRCQMKMKWITITVTQQVKFCGKTAARTA